MLVQSLGKVSGHMMMLSKNSAMVKSSHITKVEHLRQGDLHLPFLHNTNKQFQEESHVLSGIFYIELMWWHDGSIKARLPFEH